jgi:hypothetical protein
MNCHTKILFLLLIGMTSAVSAHDDEHAIHGKHEHGVADLDVMLDGRQLMLVLHSPGMNLAGFEHAATSEKDKATVDRMAKILNIPKQLFNLSSGGCIASKTTVDNPFTRTIKGDHRDIEATWEFICSGSASIMVLDARGFFRQFPATSRLKVDYALPDGQGSTTLTPQQTLAELVVK